MAERVEVEDAIEVAVPAAIVPEPLPLTLGQEVLEEVPLALRDWVEDWVTFAVGGAVGEEMGSRVKVKAPLAVVKLEADGSGVREPPRVLGDPCGVTEEEAATDRVELTEGVGPAAVAEATEKVGVKVGMEGLEVADKDGDPDAEAVGVLITEALELPEEATLPVAPREPEGVRLGVEDPDEDPLWVRDGAGLVEAQEEREAEADPVVKEDAVGDGVEDGEESGDRDTRALPVAENDLPAERVVEGHLLTAALTVGATVVLLLALFRGEAVGANTVPVGSPTVGDGVVVVEREEEGVTLPLPVALVLVPSGLAVATALEEAVKVPKGGDKEGEADTLPDRVKFREAKEEGVETAVALSRGVLEADSPGVVLGWLSDAREVKEGLGALDSVPVEVVEGVKVTTGVLQGLGDPVLNPLTVPMDTLGKEEAVRVSEEVTEGERLVVGVGDTLEVREGEEEREGMEGVPRADPDLVTLGVAEAVEELEAQPLREELGEVEGVKVGWVEGDSSGVPLKKEADAAVEGVMEGEGEIEGEVLEEAFTLEVAANDSRALALATLESVNPEDGEVVEEVVGEASPVGVVRPELEADAVKDADSEAAGLTEPTTEWDPKGDTLLVLEIDCMGESVSPPEKVPV